MLEAVGGHGAPAAAAARQAPPLACKISSLINIREIENISREDFVTNRTEASMQDVTVARLQSTRVQTPLSPLF
jgi:hypothetical protein